MQMVNGGLMEETREFTINSKTYGDFTVTIDAEDWERVSQHTWGVIMNTYKPLSEYKELPKRFYVRTSTRGEDGKQRGVFLHRFLINTPEGMHTDHINGDSMDNRKKNLRVCTSAENQANRGKNKNNTSGFKGVCRSLRSSKEKWIAKIKYQRKTHTIGCFGTREEAAMAYDEKAKEFFGEFASLNFPDDHMIN
tara:strand:- start:62 stop:643 length:582 start_codon:yes stop_codon:yes gene_type:complete